MRKLILLGVVILLLSGCKTMTPKEKVLTEGTFLEKSAYLEENNSDKDEVIEFFGPPDQKKDFYGGTSVWNYTKATEKPMEIVFGRSGKILRLEVKSKYE